MIRFGVYWKKEDNSLVQNKLLYQLHNMCENDVFLKSEEMMRLHSCDLQKFINLMDKVYIQLGVYCESY